MSSSPGQTRFDRARRAPRAPRRAAPAGPRPAPPTRLRMLRPSKLPCVADPVVGDHVVGQLAEPGLVEDGADLVRRPDVEPALLALGVGVERRVEPALGAAHLAERPLERALDHRPVALVAERLVAVQVGAGEERVVVEHLLEVGDEPDRRRRSSGRSHRRSGRGCRRAAIASRVTSAGARLADREHQLERRRRRELGRAAEAAVLHVGHHPQLAHRAFDDPTGELAVAGDDAGRRAELPADARRSPRRSSPAASSRTGRPPPSPSGSSASPGVARAGSRCRRRTAPRRDRRTTSAASRRGRSFPAPPPCRSRRRRAAPRGRP